MHKIKIQGPKNNVDACWNEIQQLIQKVGQNPNPNPNGGGNANSPFGQQQQQGLGGQQQGLGGGGGNNPICEGYIFKVNTKTMNLELLLQCTTAHGWAVPGGVMDQQNDSQLNFATGVSSINTWAIASAVGLVSSNPPDGCVM